MATASIKQLKKQALELIRLGEKVYHYRRDLLELADIETLRDATAQLEALYKNKQVGVAELNNGLQAQQGILKRTGGTFWHQRSWNENVETILVVAIVIIAFRIFFFQPFVIPTSSMHPTYSGMEPRIYTVGGDGPGALGRIATKLFQGGSHHAVEAASTGEIKIPINPMTGSYYYRPVQGRKWLVFPTTQREYLFFVGNNPHSIKVPGEFTGMERVLGETFGLLGKRRVITEQVNGTPVVSTGIEVKKGDTALQFDILMGDALFVNRLWYHFTSPKSGDAIVFRTRSFQDRPGYPDTVGEDKFYIKRLVGEPGQTLEVVDFRLLQDGKAATGAEAFEQNALREGEHSGYRNLGLLANGKTFTVPENEVFAMGDNSANSKDSRYFGPVPEKEVIGCASFIYYPFTRRWGLAK